jgi:hypothetical protein
LEISFMIKLCQSLDNLFESGRDCHSDSEKPEL